MELSPAGSGPQTPAWPAVCRLVCASLWKLRRPCASSGMSLSWTWLKPPADPTSCELPKFLFPKGPGRYGQCTLHIPPEPLIPSPAVLLCRAKQELCAGAGLVLWISLAPSEGSAPRLCVCSLLELPLHPQLPCSASSFLMDHHSRLILHLAWV